MPSLSLRLRHSGREQRRRLVVPLLVFAAAPLLARPILASDDDPGRIRFDEDRIEVSESVGAVVVRVERSSGETGAVSVQYATADGSATAGADYESASGTLTWAHGDDSDRTFTVPILADEDTESPETVSLLLSHPTGGAVLDSDRRTAVIVIGSHGGSGGGSDDGPGDDHGGGNDDGPDDDHGGGSGSGGDDDAPDAGLLKFDQRGFLATESGGVAVITLERSKGEQGEVSVSFSTADGTASAPGDYETTAATVTWPHGDGGIKTVLVPLVADGAAEGSETVLLQLDAPTGGALIDAERGSAVLTILDGAGTGDDNPGNDDDDRRSGVLKLDERSFEVVEGAGTATVVVERSRGERGAVSVTLTTFDESAEAGLDYESLTTTLSWPTGDGSSRLVQIPIFQDDSQEGNETVRLVLSDPTGGASLDPERREARLVILDDDGTRASCVGSDDTLCLQGGRFQVQTVWRTANGQSGLAHAVAESQSSGLFWFFSPDNVEMLFKALDACDVPGSDSFWVYFAATTDVDYTVRVTDTRTGLTKEYGNMLGQAAAPVQDTGTFRTCPR